MSEVREPQSDERLQMPSDPYAVPLEKIDVAQPHLFSNGDHWKYFERLRSEAPVHYCADGFDGPYWSVTKYDDICHVDSSHALFSSEPAIVLADPDEDFELEMFIAMDQPKHDVQRKTASPVVAPQNLKLLESTIRERVCTILDSLPIGTPFNWVDTVSIELTTQMLATLFDFPFEDRRKLTRWSDVATTDPEQDQSIVSSEEERRAELIECLEYFGRLWHERAGNGAGSDLISMLANGESTKDMVNKPLEYLGNLILLIVGGNDTTRNSITGGVLALNQNPAEYDKLRANPALIPNMVSEIIRWQTPLAYMRRTANEDTIVGGKTIKAGDKVAMWYISGNRDEDAIDRANEFLIDRPKARQHLSFGFGIHRCMGNRLAEMQLRILWEEIMNRFEFVEVVSEPARIFSSFVHGYADMSVVLHPKKA